MATIPMVAVQTDSYQIVKHRRQIAAERMQRRQDQLCGFMPLFQDLDFSNEPKHIQAIVGRCVNVTKDLTHHCNRFDQQWVANVQQTCFEILLNLHPKRIKNEHLKPKILDIINKDSEKYHRHRLKDPGACDTCSDAKQATIKRRQHTLHVESYGWADVEAATPVEQSVAEGHTVIESCTEHDIPRRTYYRRRGGDPKYRRKLPEWRQLRQIIREPNYKPPTFSYKHVHAEDMPSPRSKLYGECHCQSDFDESLIDRFIGGDKFSKAEKYRLRELAYNKQLF